MLLYPVDLSPPVLVRLEAAKLGMTADEYLHSKRPITYRSKQRLAWHLYMERDMPLQDVAHWMDCHFTTAFDRVQVYRKEILGHILLPRSCRGAKFDPAT